MDSDFRNQATRIGLALANAARDPMWDAHSEVPKRLLEGASVVISVLLYETRQSTPPQGGKDGVLTEISVAFDTRYEKDGVTTSTHALNNLEGAIIDIERNGKADAVSLRTLHRVAEQLARIERALKSSPTAERQKPVEQGKRDG